MERYITVVGTVQRSKFKAWLRKQMKKHEKLNLVSHTMVGAEAKTVMSTLIFEEPLGVLEAQLETMGELLGDDDPALDDWVEEEN